MGIFDLFRIAKSTQIDITTKTGADGSTLVLQQAKNNPAIRRWQIANPETPMHEMPYEKAAEHWKKHIDPTSELPKEAHKLAVIKAIALHHQSHGEARQIGHVDTHGEDVLHPKGIKESYREGQQTVLKETTGKIKEVDEGKSNKYEEMPSESWVWGATKTEKLPGSPDYPKYREAGMKISSDRMSLNKSYMESSDNFGTSRTNFEYHKGELKVPIGFAVLINQVIPSKPVSLKRDYGYIKETELKSLAGKLKEFGLDVDRDTRGISINIDNFPTPERARMMLYNAGESISFNVDGHPYRVSRMSWVQESKRKNPAPAVAVKQDAAEPKGGTLTAKTAGFTNESGEQIQVNVTKHPKYGNLNLSFSDRFPRDGELSNSLYKNGFRWSPRESCYFNRDNAKAESWLKEHFGYGEEKQEPRQAEPQAIQTKNEKVQPIRQLGTGANVYFESSKYRVNDNSKGGGVLLNIGGHDTEVPLANVEFDSPEEAVFVAKRLQELKPEGLVSGYHNIDAVVKNFKDEYAKDQPDKTTTTEPQQPAKTEQDYLDEYEGFSNSEDPGERAASDLHKKLRHARHLRGVHSKSWKNDVDEVKNLKDQYFSDSQFHESFSKPPYELPYNEFLRTRHAETGSKMVQEKLKTVAELLADIEKAPTGGRKQNGLKEELSKQEDILRKHWQYVRGMHTGNDHLAADGDHTREFHENAVLNAHKFGKTIPDAVKAEYSHLDPSWAEYKEQSPADYLSKPAHERTYDEHVDAGIAQTYQYYAKKKKEDVEKAQARYDNIPAHHTARKRDALYDLNREKERLGQISKKANGHGITRDDRMNHSHSWDTSDRTHQEAVEKAYREGKEIPEHNRERYAGVLSAIDAEKATGSAGPEPGKRTIHELRDMLVDHAMASNEGEWYRKDDTKEEFGEWNSRFHGRLHSAANDLFMRSRGISKGEEEDAGANPQYGRFQITPSEFKQIEKHGVDFYREVSDHIYHKLNGMEPPKNTRLVDDGKYPARSKRDYRHIPIHDILRDHAVVEALTGTHGNGIPYAKQQEDKETLVRFIEKHHPEIASPHDYIRYLTEGDYDQNNHQQKIGAAISQAKYQSFMKDPDPGDRHNKNEEAMRTIKRIYPDMDINQVREHLKDFPRWNDERFAKERDSIVEKTEYKHTKARGHEAWYNHGGHKITGGRYGDHSEESAKRSVAVNAASYLERIRVANEAQQWHRDRQSGDSPMNERIKAVEGKTYQDGPNNITIGKAGNRGPGWLQLTDQTGRSRYVHIDDLENEQQDAKRRTISHNEGIERRKKEDEQKQATAAKRDLGSFTNGMTPMEKERVTKHLHDKLFRYNHEGKEKIGHLRQMAEDLVSAGYRVTNMTFDDPKSKEKLENELALLKRQGYPSGNENHPQTKRALEIQQKLKEGKFERQEDVLQGPDGRFFSSEHHGKTFIDYARHIQPSAAAPDPVKTEVQVPVIQQITNPLGEKAEPREPSPAPVPDGEQEDVLSTNGTKPLDSYLHGDKLNSYKKGDIVYRNYNNRYQEYEIVDDSKDIWGLRNTETGEIEPWNANGNSGFIKIDKPTFSPKPSQKYGDLFDSIPDDHPASIIVNHPAASQIEQATTEQTPVDPEAIQAIRQDIQRSNERDPEIGQMGFNFDGELPPLETHKSRINKLAEEILPSKYRGKPNKVVHGPIKNDPLTAILPSRKNPKVNRWQSIPDTSQTNLFASLLSRLFKSTKAHEDQMGLFGSEPTKPTEPKITPSAGQVKQFGNNPDDTRILQQTKTGVLRWFDRPEMRQMSNELHSASLSKLDEIKHAIGQKVGYAVQKFGPSRGADLLHEFHDQHRRQAESHSAAIQDAVDGKTNLSETELAMLVMKHHLDNHHADEYQRAALKLRQSQPVTNTKESKPEGAAQDLFGQQKEKPTGKPIEQITNPLKNEQTGGTTRGQNLLDLFDVGPGRHGDDRPTQIDPRIHGWKNEERKGPRKSGGGEWGTQTKPVEKPTQPEASNYEPFTEYDEAGVPKGVKRFEVNLNAMVLLGKTLEFQSYAAGQFEPEDIQKAVTVLKSEGTWTYQSFRSSIASVVGFDRDRYNTLLTQMPIRATGGDSFEFDPDHDPSPIRTSQLTPEQKNLLKSYTGWGGTDIQDANEFYTPSEVVKAQWDAMRSLGYKGGIMLEPSCGTGRYIDHRPTDTIMVGVELDPISAFVAKVTHTQDSVMHSAFEQFSRGNQIKFNGTIANVPFGDRQSNPTYDQTSMAYGKHEDYFILKSLQHGAPGSVHSFIVPTGFLENKKIETMDPLADESLLLTEEGKKKLKYSQNGEIAKDIQAYGEFVGAIRLPNKTFRDAGTSVTSDVVFFRRRPDQVAKMVQSGKASDLIDPWMSSHYFKANEHHIIGERTTGNWGSEAAKGDFDPDRFRQIAEELAGKKPADYSKLGIPSEPIAPPKEGDVKKHNGQDWIFAGGKWTTRQYATELGDFSDYGYTSIHDMKAKFQDLDHAMTATHDVTALADHPVIKTYDPRFAAFLNGFRSAIQPIKTEEGKQKVFRAMMLGRIFHSGYTAAANGEPFDQSKIDRLIDATKRFTAIHGNPKDDKDIQNAARINSYAAVFQSIHDDHGQINPVIGGRTLAGERVSAQKHDPVNPHSIMKALFADSIPPTIDEIYQRYTGGKSKEAVESSLLEHPEVGTNGTHIIPFNHAVSGQVYDKIDQYRKAMETATGLYKEKLQKQIEHIEQNKPDVNLDDIRFNIQSKYVPVQAKNDFISEYLDNDLIRIREVNGTFIVEPTENENRSGWRNYGISPAHEDITISAFEDYLNGVSRSGRSDDLSMLDEDFRSFIESNPEHQGAIKDAYLKQMKNYVEPEYSMAPMEIPGFVKKNPKTGHEEYVLHPYQYASLRKFMDQGRGIISLDVGLGKAQDLNSLLLLATGDFIRMGDIKRGDMIIDGDGKPTEVIGVFPQGLKPVYEITFSDGAKARSCDEHLWPIYTANNIARKQPYSVIELKEILNEPLKRKSGAYRFAIPMLSSPVDLPKQELPVEPYVMGLLLGNGCFPGKGHSGLTISTASESIIDRIRQLYPDCEVKHQSKYDYILNGTGGTAIKQALKELGLYASRSFNKFIPPIYLKSSVEQRLSLLHGLMDTDGSASCNKRGATTVEYSSASEQLASGVRHLVLSLGGQAWITVKNAPKYSYKGEIRTGRDSYRVHIKMPGEINPFDYKAGRYISPSKYPVRRYIDNIQFVGNLETQCIAVDSPDHLYLTNDFVVTHNTAWAIAMSSMLQGTGQYRRAAFAVEKNNISKFFHEITEWSPDAKVAVVGYRVKKDKDGNAVLDQKGLTQLEPDPNWDANLTSIATGAHTHIIIPHSVLSPSTNSDRYLSLAGENYKQHELDLLKMTAKGMANDLANKAGLTDYRFDSDKITTIEELAREIDSLALRAAANIKGKDADKKQARLIEKSAEKIQKALKAIRDVNPSLRPGKTGYGNVISFENLGIDHLFLDEAHNFKSLFDAPDTTDARGESSGLTGTTSNAAINMFMLSRHLLKKNNNRGVFFMTATPITAKPHESFNLLSMVAPDLMKKEFGIDNVTDFMNTFANVTQQYKFDTSGNVELAQVVNGFKEANGFRNFLFRLLDMKNASNATVFDHNENKLKVGLKLPEEVNHRHIVPPTEYQKEKLRELISAINAMVSDRDKGELPNWIKETGKRGPRRVFTNMDTGSEIGVQNLMQRMDRLCVDECFDPHSNGFDPENPPERFKVLCSNIAESYKKGGKNLVFLDGFNFGKNGDYHKEIANYLTRKHGIPAEEIALIQGNSSEDDRYKASTDYREGRKKVIIGGTAMETGMDLQMGTTDIHHFDQPWNSTNIQQRNGRGVRQGNPVSHVNIHHYFTENGYDFYRNMTQQRKAGMLDHLYNGTTDTISSDEFEAIEKMRSLAMLSPNPERALKDIDTRMGKYDEMKRAGETEKLGRDTTSYNKAMRRHAEYKEKHDNIKGRHGNIKFSGYDWRSEVRGKLPSKIEKHNDILGDYSNATIRLAMDSMMGNSTQPLSSLREVAVQIFPDSKEKQIKFFKDIKSFAARERLLKPETTYFHHKGKNHWADEEPELYNDVLKKAHGNLMKSKKLADIYREKVLRSGSREHIDHINNDDNHSDTTQLNELALPSGHFARKGRYLVVSGIEDESKSWTHEDTNEKQSNLLRLIGNGHKTILNIDRMDYDQHRKDYKIEAGARSYLHPDNPIFSPNWKVGFTPNKDHSISLKDLRKDYRIHGHFDTPEEAEQYIKESHDAK